MDGHTGVSNKSGVKYSVQGFDLHVSLLDEGRGAYEFIAHVHPNLYSFAALTPENLLVRIGYQPFRGECPFLHGCFWKHFATLQKETGNVFGAEPIYRALEEHARKLPEIWNHFRSIANALDYKGWGSIDLFPELREFSPINIQPTKDSVPDWVDAMMPSDYHEMKRTKAEAQRALRRFTNVSGLLWETGDNLVNASQIAFKDLAIKADHTPPGHTYDLTVALSGDKGLLVEVTGLTGALKKDSPKIGQCFQALQTAPEGSRVVVLVNAFREMPILDRPKLEPITKEALSLLTNLNVVIILTEDLFATWKKYLDKPDKGIDEILKIHSAPAGLFRFK